MLESFYKNKKSILKKSLNHFKNFSSTTPKIGCELEFFLLQQNLQAVENKALVSDFIFELQEKLTKNFSLIYRVEKEQGASQVEIKTTFTSDLTRLCEELEQAKIFVKTLATQKNFTASFAAQPFFDDCGSALQFNLSLHDELDQNLFSSDENLLKNSAQFLLSATEQMMIFLAPKAEDYARFSFELNRNLFKKGKFSAPTNLSFGSDNRTCAIRLINRKKSKCLEFRLAAAGADSWLCLAAILLALSEDGAQKKTQNFEQIFGNAFDEQYELKRLCSSLEEAKSFFASEENLIRKKMEKFCF